MQNKFDHLKYIDILGEDIVSAFSQADMATTPSLVGSAREQIVRKKLSQALPNYVNVSSGCVIDKNGNVSRQIDVIVYEENAPVFNVGESDDVVYIPCECVVAVGEIKSSLGKKELSDSFQKIISVKQLKRYSINKKDELGLYSVRSYCSKISTCVVPGNEFNQSINPLDNILGFILCGNFSISKEKMAKHFVDMCVSVGDLFFPDMCLSLEDGILWLCKKNNNIYTPVDFIHESTGAVCFETETGFRDLFSKICYRIRHGRTTNADVATSYFPLLSSECNVTYVSR